MAFQIALLRGINVGRSNRIAMADLRSLVEDLGCSSVRTLLNSGNVVFDSGGQSTRALSTALGAGIRSRFGLEVPVVVISGTALNSIVEHNTLLDADTDPSKLLVAFMNSAAALRKSATLLEEDWKPEALAVGSKAAYLWCANGIIESKLAKVFAHATGDSATMRNWNTVLKLQRAAGNSSD